jgi:hypothetical protein
MEGYGNDPVPCFLEFMLPRYKLLILPGATGEEPFSLGCPCSGLQQMSQGCDASLPAFLLVPFIP